MVGDLFKHYYKQNLKLFEKKTTKSKTNHEKEDEGYVRDLVIKSLKVYTATPNVKEILGALGSWKQGFHLWDELTREGHLRSSGNGLANFCSMLVVLPLYHSRSGPVGADELVEGLYEMADQKLIQKLVRYYLFTEDPETRAYPETVVFDTPKSIVEILELTRKSMSEGQYRGIRKSIAGGLNQSERKLLEEKYPPTVFQNIHSVEKIYPLFALRSVYLESWTDDRRYGSDFQYLNELINQATLIMKSDKSKHVIKKRGKHEHYSKYTLYEPGWGDDYSLKGNVKDASRRFSEVCHDLYNDV